MTQQITDVLDHPDVDLSWQREFYQQMHRYPELSGEEVETARLIRRQLGLYDCEVVEGIGGFGMVAIFRNGEGPTALMRADFDGLPVEETTGSPFASTIKRPHNGSMVPVMHACGHDMHTTALLGACATLDATRGMWSGTFLALFQPAEEIGAGAARMVEDGLGQKIPRPTVCFGQHVVPGPAGQVMSMPGAALAACDSVTITIPGRAAHGSMPHLAVDPTYVAAMIVVRLQGIVGREISPEDFAVITVGSMRAGQSPNTIPASAELKLNTRCYSEEIRAKINAAITRVAIAECQASGTEQPNFHWYQHGELIDNDLKVYRRVRTSFDLVFGEESVDAHRWTASEDFSKIPVALGAPYVYWTVGATPRNAWNLAQANDRPGDIPVNHMGSFLPDYEPTMAAATRAAAAAVLTYLG